MEPKTWIESEIIELIENEIRTFLHERPSKRDPIDWHDLAGCIYVILNDAGLIEHTP